MSLEKKLKIAESALHNIRRAESFKSKEAMANVAIEALREIDMIDKINETCPTKF